MLTRSLLASTDSHTPSFYTQSNSPKGGFVILSDKPVKIFESSRSPSYSQEDFFEYINDCTFHENLQGILFNLRLIKSCQKNVKDKYTLIAKLCSPNPIYIDLQNCLQGDFIDLENSFNSFLLSESIEIYFAKYDQTGNAMTFQQNSIHELNKSPKKHSSKSSSKLAGCKRKSKENLKNAMITTPSVKNEERAFEHMSPKTIQSEIPKTPLPRLNFFQHTQHHSDNNFTGSRSPKYGSHSPRYDHLPFQRLNTEYEERKMEKVNIVEKEMKGQANLQQSEKKDKPFQNIKQEEVQEQEQIDEEVQQESQRNSEQNIFEGKNSRISENPYQGLIRNTSEYYPAFQINQIEEEQPQAKLLKEEKPSTTLSHRENLEKVYDLHTRFAVLMNNLKKEGKASVKSFENFEKKIVDKLNSYSRKHGCAEFMQHNGSGLNYNFITVSCKYCNKYKLQFKYSIDKNTGQANKIEFNRYLHGTLHDERVKHGGPVQYSQ